MKDIKREELLYIINKVGINDEIIKVASKMDIDIVKLFYDKLLSANENNIDENIDIISKNLLGIYGNYISTKYLNSLGYKTVNEFPVIDNKGKLLTKADIAYYDKDNMLNLCEVKMSYQILDNIRNYSDLDEENKKGSYTDKDLIIIKYKNIGKKLLKQIEKLSSTNAKVNVITFDGCYIDDIILNKLKEFNVRHIIINVNIEKLEKELKNMIYDVYNYTKAKVIR